MKRIKKVKDYSKNRSDLTTYYNVGKLLVDAQGGEARAKYGDGLIKEYSKLLTIDLNKSCGERNLRNMRQFYLLFKNQKWNTLIEDMDNFLKELGDGFCYIENEYKIKLGDRYNYIDLLLFNYEYDCFIVELKVTELKKNMLGKQNYI